MRAASLMPLLALALFGCAETLPPIPQSAAPPPAVVLEPPTEDASFVVSARSRGCENRARLEARLLREAARRTLLEGYERFRVVQTEVETERAVAWGRPGFGPRFGTGFGVGFGTGDGGFARWGFGTPFSFLDYYDRDRFGWRDPFYHGPRYGRSVCVARAARAEILALAGEPDAAEAAGTVYRAEDAILAANRTLGGR